MAPAAAWALAAWASAVWASAAASAPPKAEAASERRAPCARGLRAPRVPAPAGQGRGMARGRPGAAGHGQARTPRGITAEGLRGREVGQERGPLLPQPLP